MLYEALLFFFFFCFLLVCLLAGLLFCVVVHFSRSLVPFCWLFFLLALSLHPGLAFVVGLTARHRPSSFAPSDGFLCPSVPLAHYVFVNFLSTLCFFVFSFLDAVVCALLEVTVSFVPVFAFWVVCPRALCLVVFACFIGHSFGFALPAFAPPLSWARPCLVRFCHVLCPFSSGRFISSFFCPSVSGWTVFPSACSPFYSWTCPFPPSWYSFTRVPWFFPPPHSSRDSPSFAVPCRSLPFFRLALSAGLPGSPPSYLSVVSLRFHYFGTYWSASVGRFLRTLVTSGPLSSLHSPLRRLCGVAPSPPALPTPLLSLRCAVLPRHLPLFTPVHPSRSLASIAHLCTPSRRLTPQRLHRPLAAPLFLVVVCTQRTASSSRVSSPPQFCASFLCPGSVTLALLFCFTAGPSRLSPHSLRLPFSFPHPGPPIASAASLPCILT